MTKIRYGRKLRGNDFSGKKLIGSLTRKVLIKKNGDTIKFSEENLQCANFEGTEIQNIDFSNSLIQGCNFRNSKLFNVTFDRVQTGMSSRVSLGLRTISFLIAFFAGVICGYSMFFLMGMILDPHCTADCSAIQNQQRILAIVACLVLLLALGTACFLGIRVVFFGIVITFSATAFIFVAVETRDFAGVWILGLACFVGVISGIIVQSQANYLNEMFDYRRLQYLKTIDDFYQSRHRTLAGLRLLLLWVFLITGIVIGGFLSWPEGEGKPPQEMFLFPIAFMLLGNYFSYRARKEKGSKYAVIRSLFDAISSKLDTNFYGATLVNVSFNDADLKHADFSDVIIGPGTSFSGTNFDFQKKNVLSSDGTKENGSSKEFNIYIEKFIGAFSGSGDVTVNDGINVDDSV